MERFGEKFDHVLLTIRWVWRLRVHKQQPKPDFSRMTLQNWTTLNEVLRKKLETGVNEVCTDVGTNTTNVLQVV